MKLENEHSSLFHLTNRHFDGYFLFVYSNYTRTKAHRYLNILARYRLRIATNDELLVCCEFIATIMLPQRGIQQPSYHLFVHIVNLHL